MESMIANRALRAKALALLAAALLAGCGDERQMAEEKGSAFSTLPTLENGWKPVKEHPGQEMWRSRTQALELPHGWLVRYARDGWSGMAFVPRPVEEKR